MSDATVVSSSPKKRPDLPIFSIIDGIDFDDHFVILGDVGTGKTTITPIHEFRNVTGGKREIVIREPSRASCNALYYSLQALYPELKDELAVITKDTKINVDRGKIRIVTDGVLLRMLAENSLNDTSIYFDESHQMTSQLELCMSLAKKNNIAGRRNLFRIMSATIDPAEFLSFMGIKNLYTVSGRRFPVSIELEMAKDNFEMQDKLSYYLYSQPESESWLIFLPTRRLVERFARSYGGVFLHGGLEGSEVNKIQQRAEIDKNLKIFATNVIASSVNLYVDNVLIFNEMIEGRDKLGHKVLEYKSIDNNSMLQMIGRIGRFKPGRAVILSDVPIPKTINPKKVFKALERETPFDLVLLMSKYGLKLRDQEFMSKLNMGELAFAEKWLFEIGAIREETHEITEKGILMSEIPFDPDFAHMISEAIVRGHRDIARFLLAAGAFGDSLNHAYRTEMEAAAIEFLYALDKTSELGVKAKLLQRYSQDREGRFVEILVNNGIFPRFIEEAWKNFDAARDSLNDILRREDKPEISPEVLGELDSSSLLEDYLKDCLTFERYYLHEAKEFGIDYLRIEGDFFARSLTMNFRKILYDLVALND